MSRQEFFCDVAGAKAREAFGFGLDGSALRGRRLLQLRPFGIKGSNKA